MKLTSKTINYTVDTIEQLLLTTGTENDTVIVTDENRGGVFVYREDNSSTNNGGTIFNGWTRQYDGAVSVKWFGSDFNALKTAIESGYDVCISDDITVISDGSLIEIQSNQTISGSGKIISISNSENNGYLFSIDAKTNIKIDGIHFSTPNRHRMIYSTGETKNVKIVNCTIESTSISGYSAYGVVFGLNDEDAIERENISILGCTFINMCGSASIKINGCRNVTIADSTFDVTISGFAYPNYPTQIDFEDGNSGTVSGCYFVVPASNGVGDSRGYAIYQGDGSFHKLVLDGNSIKGGTSGVQVGIKVGGGASSDNCIINGNTITEVTQGIECTYLKKAIITSNMVDDSNTALWLQYGTGATVSGNYFSTNSSTNFHTIVIGENSAFPYLSPIYITGNYIKNKNNINYRYCIGIYNLHPIAVIRGNTFDIAYASGKYIANIATDTEITQSNGTTYNIVLTSNKDNAKVKAGSIVDEKYGILFGANQGYQTGYNTNYSLDGAGLGTTNTEIVTYQNSVSTIIGQVAITNQASGYAGRLGASLRALTSSVNVGRTDVRIVGVNNSGVEHYIELGYDATFKMSNDNATSLGTASRRWSTVYAGTGTINTSDAREKTFSDIPEVEMQVAKELKSLVRRFKFNDAMEAKGEDKARIHYGTSAQEVIEVFAKYNLDAMEYGMVCYDEWEEEPEVKDEEGNITQPYRPAGNRYGIRYEELIMFILGGM